MEHIPGIPLDKYIYKNGKLKEPTIQLYTKQIVQAIAYMHSKFVMHRYAIIIVSLGSNIKWSNNK